MFTFYKVLCYASLKMYGILGKHNVFQKDVENKLVKL